MARVYCSTVWSKAIFHAMDVDISRFIVRRWRLSFQQPRRSIASMHDGCSCTSHSPVPCSTTSAVKTTLPWYVMDDGLPGRSMLSALNDAQPSVNCNAFMQQHQLLSLYAIHFMTYTVSQNNHTRNCGRNSNKHCHILILFDENITQKF